MYVTCKLEYPTKIPFSIFFLFNKNTVATKTGATKTLFGVLVLVSFVYKEIESLNDNNSPIENEYYNITVTVENRGRHMKQNII